MDFLDGHGAEVSHAHKPDPAFFQAAPGKLGVDAGQAVMIGDGIHSDIEGAQRAGLRALLMRTGNFRDSDLSLGIEPDAVPDSLDALPDWYRNAGFET